MHPWSDVMMIAWQRVKGQLKRFQSSRFVPSLLRSRYLGHHATLAPRSERYVTPQITAAKETRFVPGTPRSFQLFLRPLPSNYCCNICRTGALGVMPSFISKRQIYSCIVSVYCEQLWLVMVHGYSSCFRTRRKVLRFRKTKWWLKWKLFAKDLCKETLYKHGYWGKRRVFKLR